MTGGQYEPLDRFEQQEEDLNWRKLGACGQIDPDTWFPERGEPGKSKRAREICRTQCEVRAQCLRYALEHPSIQHGIWAGYSADEIRKMRRQRGLDGGRIPEDMEPEDPSVYVE